MLAVIYRWRLKPSLEQQFVDGWTRVTKAIHLRCGSYGSRLHQAEDGTWVAYARWPDAATREACEHGDIEASRMMREAVEQEFDDIVMTISVDLLQEPQRSEGP